MLHKVKAFIDSQALFSTSDRIIVAISGGKDSISLAHILKHLGYSIALAHCNFHLRNSESDEDETFVKQWAKQEQLPLFVKHFNTKKYAEQHKISIQEAARELRYNWFEELRTQEQFNYIATAHHQQDVIETFFINLIRGTGIEGLCSIKAQNQYIVRPLLNSSLEEIIQYIKKHHLTYRHDSSNASTKYLRNKIRHQLMPQFRDISPQFDTTMIKNIERLNQVNTIYKTETQQTVNALCEKTEEGLFININKLKTLKTPFVYLYELLKDYGFNSSIIKDISNSLDSESGKIFISPNYRLLKDRELLILTAQNTNQPDSNIKIELTDKEIKAPIHLKIQQQATNSPLFKIEKKAEMAYLDLEQLHFPLTLRKWKKGDTISPLGMRNKSKKISDILIDLKIPRSQKENIYVLESKDEIVWLVGIRISELFKINENTQNAFILEVV